TFLERAEEFEGRSHVRIWLFGILYKKIAEARREARRDEQMADIDGVVEQRFNATGSWVNPPRPIEGEVYAAEVRERLTECLDAVPTQQRMAFVLLGLCFLLRKEELRCGPVIERGEVWLHQTLLSSPPAVP